MNEGRRKLTLIVAGLLVAGLSYVLGYKTYRPGQETGITTKVDSTSTIDSNVVTRPRTKDSTLIHHIYVKLPVVPNPANSVPASQDSVPASQDSVPASQDSALVEIPIERKVYQEDSLYRAVVSGYRVNLDSLIIYNTTTTVTVTKVERVQPKRWRFGVTIGPSVLTTQAGSVYAGLGASIGVSYTF